MAITLLVDPITLATSGRKRSRSESTSMPSNKKQRFACPPKAKKSVRFHSMLEVFQVDRVDEADIPFVWYSKDEFRQSKRRDQQMVRTQLSESFSEALVDILEATTNPGVSTNHKSCARVSASEFRGLERELLPCFRQRKRQVTHNVLKSQAALQQWQAAHPEKSADHTAMILASHCRKLAQPSQRFARLLAHGDAIAVAAGL